MDSETADTISHAWARASLVQDGRVHIHDAERQFSANLTRFIVAEPDDDSWAILDIASDVEGLGEPPKGYLWTRSAAILYDDTLWCAAGAVDAEHGLVAVAIRRFDDVTVDRVLHSIKSGGHTARWTFAADDTTLHVEERLDERERPVSTPDQSGAFARKLAKSAGWEIESS